MPAKIAGAIRVDYVSDTHALYWYFTGSDELSIKAKAIWDDSVGGSAIIFVPAIVIAELQFLLERNRSQRPLSDYINTMDSFAGVRMLDLVVAQF